MKTNCEHTLGRFRWLVLLAISLSKSNISASVLWLGLPPFCRFSSRLLEPDWLAFTPWPGIFGLGAMKGRPTGGLGRIGGGYEPDIIKFWELLDLSGHFWTSLVQLLTLEINCGNWVKIQRDNLAERNDKGPGGITTWITARD